MPAEFQETFMPFFNIVNDKSDNFRTDIALYFTKSSNLHNLKELNWSDLSFVSLPKSYQRMVLDKDDLSLLLNCYQALYPSNCHIEINCLSPVAKKYAYVCLGTEKFGSKKENKSLRSSRVMASWANMEGSIDSSSPIRPGQVMFYFQHAVVINGVTKEHVMCSVKWYQQDEERDIFGNPCQVWKSKDFDEPGPAVFMPAQRIANTYAACFVMRSGMSKIVINPIQRLFH